MSKIIESSEMPLNPDGSIYHLHLQPEQIADKVILVGDPGRVSTVSRLFDRIDFKVQNRELYTHTGMLNGKRISVLSTGMGTDNIDIVVNELDALVNVDLARREPKDKKTSLQLIRLGTSGSLRADYPVNRFCAATHGLGFDGLLNYYAVNENIFDKAMEKALLEHLQMPASLARPYIVPCTQSLMDKMGYDMLQGITATASGFFGPQGRVVRLPLTFPEQNDRLETFEYNGYKVSNLEMETSALYGLGQSLGHETLTICVLVANRITKDFSENYKPHVEKLIETVLTRFTA